MGGMKYKDIAEFQSTLPRRERRMWVIAEGLVYDFNPRSREEKRLSVYHEQTQRLVYDFNPRSREGSDNLRMKNIIVSDDISIHAPAKGATNPLYKLTWDCTISIHAPAKGATKSEV